MAPAYPQYNNYYDPVGSQANQPQGYAYHNPGTSVSQPPSVTYSAQSYPSYGHNTYNTVQQGANTSGQHHAGSSGVGTSSAEGGTGSITGTGQNNQASASRSGTTQQYDSGWGNPNYATSSYSGNLQIPGRSQSNTSPVYASSGSSANNFGRSTNAMNQPAQSNIPTYGQQTGSQNYSSTGSADNSRMTYGASQRGIAAGEPSRYASPLHAVQAQQQQSRQQGHTRQSSQTSTYQATPATNSRGSDQRRESATMAAAANTTVDPSQVYDFRAERERKAKIEAEKRRKQDEADAARKAEEARVAEAKRLTEEQQASEAKRRMEEAKRQSDEARAAAKAEADRRKDEQRKARESKNAATALASLASSSSAPHMNEAEPPANDEEAEMRAMFQKMREFNSKNPAMLAKLWEEERRAHAGQSQSPQPAQVTQPAASTPKPAVPSKASSSQASAANATASNSAKPAPAEKAKASKASPNMSVARSKAPEVTTNQGSTNLWPPGKKGLLADIAARWLHGVNPQEVVTAFEILQLLDQNPNYVQLCESLEGLGLKFERAAFARELLRGVPPASSANQHTSKGSDATIMSANGTLAQATGAAAVGGTEHTPSLQASSAPGQQQRRPSSLMGWNNQPNGKATSSNNGMVDYEMPSFHNSSAPNQTADGTSFSSQPGRAGPQSAIGNSHSRQPSQSVQPSRRSMSNVQQGAPVPVGSARQTPDVKPMSPPRPPANKEEAARKRGFGELVDLTAEESDEDAPPKKIMQTAQGFGPRPFQPQPPQSQPHLNQQRDSPFAFNTRGAPVVPTGPSPGSTAPPFNPPGVPGIPAVANMGRMSTGSPAMTPTANMRATDVSGPVSAKPPLPSSTMLPFKRKGPTNEQLQAERIRGKMVVEPIMRDRVARKSTYDSRTIARDVLLATGRHPDMRALNSHLNVMQKMLGDRGGMADGSGNKSDLATIKWDIIDPDPPKKKESSSLVQAQDVAEIQDADDEGDMSSLNHKHRAPGGAATARQSSAALDLRDKPATPDAMPKKRGRPPRSSMPGTHTFVSVNDKMSAAGQQGMGAAGTPRQGSGQPGTPATVPAARPPAASQAPTDGSVGYSAFRHFDENGNPIKKKGRPVGWRKNIHSREAQGLAPAKSASAGVKPKPAVPKQPEKLQEPNYQVYRCKWLGCAAELHSLDVLKKHMIKVHGRPDGEDLFECLWQDCESKTKRVTGPGRTRLDNATFSDIGGWLSHVDKEHLQPVAWRLGDGPRGGLSDQAESEASEAYLSDSRGRSVTPIIQPMANFGFGQNLPARIGRPPAGASKDERGAQAELQKLKERKIAVGPTMEKMGVRLANEKRRMGFLDDENFEDIVESESE